jgi:hypothetical protein
MRRHTGVTRGRPGVEVDGGGSSDERVGVDGALVAADSAAETGRSVAPTPVLP